jgi:hypothetical protein
MAWWQNPWLPWNYPKDLSNSFMQQLENGLLYLFAHILDGILGLISSIMGMIMSIIQDFLGLLINSSIALGPLALPVFVIGSAILIATLYLVFALAKDMPVVGSFV